MGIKNARLAKGISQEELALKLSLDRSTVAKWETGKALPRAELLLKLAQILECSVDDLLKAPAVENHEPS